jgi:ATP-dependent Lhr-like helicase
VARAADPLASFHAPVRDWFRSAFPEATRAQKLGWPSILAGRSTLLLAPTGSGKTLAAFLAAIDKLTFSPEPPAKERCRVLYVSPLKALAVDVERNLRSPLVGIARPRRGGRSLPLADGRDPLRRHAGGRAGAHRADAPDILITTPESLYLLLTSNAREALRALETVIVDEIHSLAAPSAGRTSSSRSSGSRPCGPRARRRCSGSACRPRRGRSRKVARLLGGGVAGKRKGSWKPRPVEIVDAGSAKRFDLEGRGARRGHGAPLRGGDPSGPAAAGPRGDPLAHDSSAVGRAHPRAPLDDDLRQQPAPGRAPRGGPERDRGGRDRARPPRLDRQGEAGGDRGPFEARDLPAIVATSSLELGIDMGAVDLVVQIEAPPSVASGMQRIGRASHTVGAVSRGVLFPKYRGDLLACAAVTAAMAQGKVEETRYPKNPLDVLAQQIVATVAMDTIGVDDLYRLVRGAALRRAAALAPSKACSTCSRAATPPTSSRSCARA